MPEHVSRLAAVPYDQDEDEQVADWGGDTLFTRMPRPRPVDDAPAPRFRPSLVLVDSPPDNPDAARAGTDDRVPAPAKRFASPPSRVSVPRASTVPAAAARDLGPATVRHWDESPGARPEGRPTTVITGRPDSGLRVVRPPAPRPERSPTAWIGARPERLVAWAFALGLLLILIAISTADAATH